MFNFKIVAFACLFFVTTNSKPLKTSDEKNRTKRSLLDNFPTDVKLYRVFNNENPDGSLVEKFLEVQTQPINVYQHGSYTIFVPSIEDDEDYGDYDSDVDYFEEENENSPSNEPFEGVVVDNVEIDNLEPHTATVSSNEDASEENLITNLLLPETLNEIEWKNIFTYPNNFTTSSTEPTSNIVTENAENATFVSQISNSNVTEPVNAENIVNVSPVTENVDSVISKLFTSYLNDSQTSTASPNLPNISSIPLEAINENTSNLLFNQSNLNAVAPDEDVGRCNDTNGSLAKNCSKGEDTKTDTLFVTNSLEQNTNNSDVNTTTPVYDKLYIEFTSFNGSSAILHGRGDSKNFWMNTHPEIVGEVLRRRPLWYSLLLDKMIDFFIIKAAGNKTSGYVAQKSLRKYLPSKPQREAKIDLRRSDIW